MSDIKIGDTFWYLGADVSVVAVGSPDDAFPVRDGEIGIRAMSRDDADTLGWLPCMNGEYEAVTARAEFIAVAEQTTLEQPGEPFDLDNFVDAVTGAPAAEVLADAEAPQDHGPLAGTLSDRTLAKVLSRPAYDPPSPTKDAIVEAALRWHAIRNANAEDVTPLALFDADDALNMAVKAHIAAVTS